jgi:hypothetical protein
MTVRVLLNGRPAPRAPVYAGLPGVVYEGETRPDGTCGFGALGAGSYTVYVDPLRATWRRFNRG